jgi:hypothetical protein
MGSKVTGLLLLLLRLSALKGRLPGGYVLLGIIGNPGEGVTVR